MLWLGVGDDSTVGIGIQKAGVTLVCLEDHLLGTRIAHIGAKLLALGSYDGVGLGHNRSQNSTGGTFAMGSGDGVDPFAAQHYRQCLFAMQRLDSHLFCSLELWIGGLDRRTVDHRIDIRSDIGSLLRHKNIYPLFLELSG